MTITAEQPEAAIEHPVASAECEHQCHEQMVMIIDDVLVNLKVVRAHLHTAGYLNVRAISDSTEALGAIHRESPDLVLLDLMMPEVSGLDILTSLRSDDQMKHLPVVMLTGSESSELRKRALLLGASDFLTKPIDSDELILRVRNSLLMKSYQDDLERRVRDRTRQLESSRRELVFRLARAAEYRDNETGRHVIRVGCYAGIIADELGLPTERVEMIEQAATLHDLGKIGIPDAILHKPGKLTPEEFEIIGKHCGIGLHICESLDPTENQIYARHAEVGSKILQGCDMPLMELAGVIALTHHERWDGCGYPLGLSGEDIPLEGRITSIADVFDALSSKRPYKPAFPLEKCLKILEEGRGTQFDATILDAFFARKLDIVKTQIKYADHE